MPDNKRLSSEAYLFWCTARDIREILRQPPTRSADDAILDLLGEMTSFRDFSDTSQVRERAAAFMHELVPSIDSDVA